MKTGLRLVLVAAIAAVATGLVVSNTVAKRSARRLAEQQALWQAERTELESALQQARDSTPRVSPPIQQPVAPAAPVVHRLTPEEILARLEALGAGATPKPPPVLRQAVYWLEELVQRGEPALPPTRLFLARYEDFELDAAPFVSRFARDHVPLEFAVPPSLRFGLFDAVRRVGGPEAVVILAESLTRTGRGAEIAYLVRVLQQLAPNRYRDQALAIVRGLLAQAAPSTNSPLDRNHRDYLFGVLAFYGDTSFAKEAQTQLVRADSQVDRGALKYLQETLGAQAVPIVAQAYQNPLLTNSAGKEPLARLALNFVGVDAQANEFYQQTINDPLLTRSHRKNLIEDLNQDGFADTKNLSAKDLPLIQNRISLIEQLAPKAMDDANSAAFREAYKDLLNMRTKITGQANLPTP
jgi:hypothetical protein